MDVNENLQYHTHTGTDSPKIDGVNLVNSPQSALTTASALSLSSGGTENMTNNDAAIINNIITRLNELETKLRDLHIIL